MHSLIVPHGEEHSDQGYSGAPLFKKKSFLLKNIIIIFAVLGLFFVALHGLFLVAASGGSFSLWSSCFSLQWLFLLWSPGSRPVGFSSGGAWAELPLGTWTLPGLGVELMSPALAGGFLTAGPAGKFPDEASDSLEHVGLPLISLCPWTSSCTSQCLSCYIQKMRLIGLPSQPVAGVEFISTGQMRSTVREPCFPLGTVELASLLNSSFLNHSAQSLLLHLTAFQILLILLLTHK